MYACIIQHVDGWNWKQNNRETEAEKRNEKWNQNLHKLTLFTERQKIQ